MGTIPWSTARNWVDNTVPGPADTLIFDSQANTDSVMDANFGNKIAVVKINPGFGKHSVSINAPLTVTSDLLLNDQNGTLVTNVTFRFGRNPQGVPIDVTFAINNWSFQAGKTDGKGVIEVTNLLIWSGGIIGNSSTLTLGASISIFSGQNIGMNHNSFTNLGTVILLSDLGVTLSYFYNSGNFFIAGDHDIFDRSPPRLSSGIANLGTFSKLRGIGTSSIYPTFNNTLVGTVNVYTGTLRLHGSHWGKFYIASGATLEFGPNVVNTLYGSVKFSGTGWVVDRGDLVIVKGANVRIFNFQLGPAVVKNLQARLRGEGSLSAHYFKWNAGTMQDPGITQIGPGDKMDIMTKDSKDPKRLIGRILIIQGTANWKDDDIQTDKSAIIRIDGLVGSLNILAGVSITLAPPKPDQRPSSKVILTNFGVLRKAPGGGKTTINIQVENWGGKFEDDPGQKVDFTKGYFQFSGKTLIEAGAIMNVIGGALKQFGGMINIIGGTLKGAGAPIELDGGIVTGPGTIQGTIVNNGGQIFPGGPGGTGLLTLAALPGSNLFTGDYLTPITGSGGIHINIASDGSAYDQFKIAGLAQFNPNQLGVTFLNGPGPTGGSFPVITYGSHAGDFISLSSFSWTVNQTNYNFNPAYNPTNLTLVVAAATTAPGPTINAIYLSSGATSASTAGGETVTINGQYFTGTADVMFGSIPATSFVVNSDTTITAVTPPHAAGNVSVQVTTHRGFAGKTLTYSNAAVAVVSGVTPSSDPTDGTNFVTITGSGFTGASTVSFGTPTAFFKVISDSLIVAQAPTSNPVGTYDVTVTTPSGTSATGSADHFTLAFADVAQWQSTAFVKRGLRVQIPPSAFL